MSLLTIIQAAAVELALTSPTSVIGNSDALVQQLLAHANREGKELRNKIDWPELTREYIFTLSTSTANYAMPGDFERFDFMSHWDRTNHWQIIGPLDSEDWQLRKSGITSNAPRIRWRFKGFQTNQFYLDPTPTSGQNGNTLVFEYQSKNWCRPRTWATSTSYAANSYTFYNGNYYSTVAGGTTGATPPTHTSSSASDGAVTWVYLSTPYEVFIADTDLSNLDENLIVYGVKWRFKEANGLDWQNARAEYEAAVARLSSANRGAANLNMNSGRWLRALPYPFIPDSNFGT